MSEYNSSIINNYGDMPNVKEDAKTLRDIINRQGAKLLIDAVSEHAGDTANKFSMNTSDRENIIKCLILDLSTALRERL